MADSPTSRSGNQHRHIPPHTTPSSLCRRATPLQMCNLFISAPRIRKRTNIPLLRVSDLRYGGCHRVTGLRRLRRWTPSRQGSRDGRDLMTKSTCRRCVMPASRINTQFRVKGDIFGAPSQEGSNLLGFCRRAWGKVQIRGRLMQTAGKVNGPLLHKPCFPLFGIVPFQDLGRQRWVHTFT